MKNNETIIDTKSLADLSKLSFSDNELLSFEKDMKDIVSFAKAVEKADSCDTAAQSTFKNVMREDSVLQSCSRSILMEVAPSHKDGFFSVPRVVEGV